MFEHITEAHARILDEIMEDRCSVRAFNEELPKKEEIEQKIRAGLRSPFAGRPAKGTKDFRKVFVLRTDSGIADRIVELLIEGQTKLGNELLGVPEGTQPEGREYFFRNAPYLIIAAERKGMPITYMNNHSISISYCMYGMWLKAVTLKIGFKLLSAIIHANLGNNEEFCSLVGLPVGEYALDSCVIGYPHDNFNRGPVNYPDYEGNAVWL